MSSETTELQASKNWIIRLIGKFRVEYTAVAIASVALILTVVSLIMSALANNTGNRAEAKVDYELYATRAEIDLCTQITQVGNIRTGKLHAWLEAHGVPVEEIIE